MNDENRGVCPGGKHNNSSTDIFALDQPTGRPSILRQTENLPSKTVPKGMKVQNQLLVIVLDAMFPLTYRFFFFPHTNETRLKTV